MAVHRFEYRHLRPKAHLYRKEWCERNDEDERQSDSWETKTLTIQCGLEMNARPENPDEDQRNDASGDDPNIASVQLGWFC